MTSRSTRAVAVSLLFLAAGSRADSQTADPVAVKPTATVFFYSTGIDLPGTLIAKGPAIEIQVDRKPVAKLGKNKFFAVRLAAGQHAIASKSMRTAPEETEVRLNLWAGREVFIRVVVVVQPGFPRPKWTGHLRVVENDEGRAAISGLRAIGTGDVRDRSTVVVSPAEVEQALTDGAVSQTTAAVVEPAMELDALPNQVGVYRLRDGTLDQMRAEIVTLRNPGKVGCCGVGEAGIIEGAASTVLLQPPLEFVIRSPENATAADYVLLQLKQKTDHREFTTAVGAGLWTADGPQQMSIPFQVRRVSAGTYQVRVEALAKGEYGFVVPGAAFSESVASVGRIHTFSVR